VLHGLFSPPLAGEGEVRGAAPRTIDADLPTNQSFVSSSPPGVAEASGWIRTFQFGAMDGHEAFTPPTLQAMTCTAAVPDISYAADTPRYPICPVRVVLGLPAGGSVDIVTRLISQWLSERLGQPFIVENRPGASGDIATEAVVRAPPDGYTILIVLAANAVNATLHGNLKFSPIRDIEMVAGMVRVPNVMEVNPAVPAATVPEFHAYARANPGKLSFASGGNGSSLHVIGELFKMMAGVDMVHVPYRGGAAEQRR
jgi:tripartite-type tricarboxylate transporter receptor subunit TctC